VDPAVVSSNRFFMGPCRAFHLALFFDLRLLLREEGDVGAGAMGGASRTRRARRI
jgi:hypothetical protein